MVADFEVSNACRKEKGTRQGSARAHVAMR
jgi:hypothetical protein